MNDLRDNISPLRIKIVIIGSVLALILTGLIFFNSCQKTSVQLPVLYEESDWERMRLHGDVNTLSLYEISCEEAFNKITSHSSDFVDQSTTYNVKGNQVESTYYNINGIPKWKDVFGYADDDETWLDCISYTFLTEDQTLSQWSYTNIYDSNDRLIRVEGYDYDDSGHILSDVSWIHIYEYLDDAGQIAQSSYDSQGSLQWKNITLYNARGLENEVVHYNADGIMQWKDSYKYNDKDNKTEWCRYDSDGTLEWKDIYKYDDAGNEIECSNYNYAGILTWKNLYLYLDEGDLDNLEINNSISLKNSFDNYGNWTIKLTLEEKEGFGSTYLDVKEIEKRIITYFP